MTIPKRTLGKTNFQVSSIGFGGIVVTDAAPKDAANIVAHSIDEGINYFDVAPSYGDAEVKLGPALQPFRKEIYLACKTGERDRKGAEKELKNSLKLLKTDYFDVYQLHGLDDIEKDVKAALSKDGAIQTLIDAKNNGIIRNIGFSAHSPQVALTAMDLFDFDTVMYPVNFCTHFNSNLETEVLERAKKENLGIIAIKTLAEQLWQNEQDKKLYPHCWYQPIDDPELAQLALNWTLQQGISIALSPGEEKLLRLLIELVKKTSTLTESQTNHLKQVAKNLNQIF